MTCSVNGGKPLVTSVIFSRDGHSDTAPDVTTHDHVHSFLTINPLGAEDDGERCVCTAEWKDTDWYKLSATVILRVNGENILNHPPPPHPTPTTSFSASLNQNPSFLFMFKAVEQNTI